jgi:hypothetical protein
MTSPVLLVGSVPLESSEAVFREVSNRIGDTLKRVPDGETGVRAAWTAWQGSVVERTKGVARTGERDLQGIAYPTYDLAPGTSTRDIGFGDLGYAASALSSYKTFTQMRNQGFNRQARFQVSLPTPLAVVQAFFWGSPALPEICKVYEKALLGEVDRILRSIPHDDLSLQWDIAVEFHRIWEKPDSDLARMFPNDLLISTIARLSGYIPEPVELGWHFCYGDAGHKHFVEPRDTALMTNVANQLKAAMRRPLTWLHLPVPREREDTAYFTPLRGLVVDKKTELFLGLIHLTDGVDGAKRRMASANRTVGNYGVATECGFGRRRPDTILSLLDLHRAVAAL